MASEITNLTIVFFTQAFIQAQKTSKFRVTGLCEGNTPVTGEFSTQSASNAEKVSIWWRHHELIQVMACCNTASNMFQREAYTGAYRGEKVVQITIEVSWKLWIQKLVTDIWPVCQNKLENRGGNLQFQSLWWS